MATPDQIRRRGRWSLVIGTVVAALMLVAVAYADNVQNDVTVGGNDTFTAGGSTTVNYRITANNGDGQTGCNASDGSPATVTINAPAGVTATPSSRVFTSCGVNQSVAFSSPTPGDYVISVTVGDTGVGTYNTAPARFTLHVLAPSDSTPPVITPSVSGTLGNDDWYTSDVDVTWTVVDNESSISSSSGCGATTITSDTSGTTLTCSATSAGGTSSQSVTIKRDATAPTISGSASPAPNANGWNDEDVTVTFTCSDLRSGIASCAPPQTLSTEGAGQSASGIATDNAGNTATTTVDGINIDKTAPTANASPAPAANANGWNNTDVTVTFSGSDGLSGIDDCTDPALLSSEGAGQSASGTCTDKAGNASNTATASGINIDKTAPTITDLGPTASPNGNGWYKVDVTNRFQASDGLSGLDSDCLADYPDSGGDRVQQKTTSGEGTAVTVSSDGCTDLAGNSAAAKTSAEFKIDMMAPTATATATPAPNANGWNNTDVTVSFSGSDALSTIDFCDADVVLSDEGSGQSASGTCTDKAGNVSATATASGINIDKTAPTLTWAGGPAPGSSHYFGFVPAAPSCSAVDGLSGPDTCSVSGYGTSVGSHTMTATAEDKAGNTSTEQRSYTVLAWTLTGFFQPVDMGGVFNVVKNGSTVPLKFRIFAGSTELTDVANVKSLKHGLVACDATAPNDDIETTATGGTSLRYDGSGGQFIYNWKTPSTPGKCYSVTMTTQDGSTLSAYFRLK